MPARTSGYKKAKSRIVRRYKYAKSALGKSQTRAVKAIVNKTLNRVIETKESTRNSGTNINMPHNNVYIVQDVVGGNLNPFFTQSGTGDPHALSTGQRIGDQITLKGLLIKGMVEGSLQRSKVHFKVMLLRGPQGASFNRADIFKGNSNNKILDQINTERYKIIAMAKFNVSPPNNGTASTINIAGLPNGQTAAISGNKVFNIWVPGRKFGKTINYENGNSGQVRFYDYRLVILSYDWFGTPQDSNNVGLLNELYTKIYFKDA